MKLMHFTRIWMASAIFAAQLLLRLTALDAHASVIVGQSISASSWWLGPLVVLIRLLAYVVAPILLGSVLVELAWTKLRARALAEPRNVGSDALDVSR